MVGTDAQGRRGPSRRAATSDGRTGRSCRCARPLRGSRIRAGLARRSTPSSWPGSRPPGWPRRPGPTADPDPPRHDRPLGLPPTPEEVDAFEADPTPDAFARLVDRLLASPRYGERWGRHWLDVARYADTKGYVFTQDRRYPYAYTYRDYVIAPSTRTCPTTGSSSSSSPPISCLEATTHGRWPRWAS